MWTYQADKSQGDKLLNMQFPTKHRELHNHHFDSTVWNDFKFRDDDIVISTYAKSGTTWVQQIVSQLLDTLNRAALNGLSLEEADEQTHDEARSHQWQDARQEQPAVDEGATSQREPAAHDDVEGAVNHPPAEPGHIDEEPA